MLYSGSCESMEGVPVYVNRSLLNWQSAGYTKRGVRHPSLQAIDRPAGMISKESIGVRHPSLQAIDRMRTLIAIFSAGVRHPSLQAIDRTSFATQFLHV